MGARALARKVSRDRGSARAVLAGVALILSACSGRDDTVQLLVAGDETSELGELHAGSTPAPPDTSIPPDTSTPPDTPVGRQLLWIIEVVNRRSAPLVAAEIEAHFDAPYLSVVSHDELVELFADPARDAPLMFLEVSPDTSDDSVLALVEGNGTHLTIGINVALSTGKITGLQFLRLAPL